MIFGPSENTERAAIGSLVDSRMTKRALRAKLALKSDAHLAKVLQLTTAEVEAWPEEQGVPALPQVVQLLGIQPQPEAATAPEDTDIDRIVSVDAA